MDPESVFVLVPDKHGVTVASLAQLIGRVDETVTLAELVTERWHGLGWHWRRRRGPG
jgi:hypothetical protein